MDNSILFEFLWTDFRGWNEIITRAADMVGAKITIINNSEKQYEYEQLYIDPYRLAEQTCDLINTGKSEYFLDIGGFDLNAKVENDMIYVDTIINHDNKFSLTVSKSIYYKSILNYCKVFLAEMDKINPVYNSDSAALENRNKYNKLIELIQSQIE